LQNQREKTNVQRSEIIMDGYRTKEKKQTYRTKKE
jgi:hypothetical protein